MIKPFELDNHPGQYLPRYYRTFHYDQTKDVIFFPCTEPQARQGAALGAVTLTDDEGHVFMPMHWLRKIAPGAGYDLVEERIREFLTERGEVLKTWA